MNPRTLILAAALGLSQAAAAQTLINPSFEFGAPTNTTGAAPIGGWGWDQSAFVPAMMGITPASGNRMLRFIATDATGPSADPNSRIAQMVNFSSMASQINSGAVTVTFGASFNRNLGTRPNFSDSLFRVIVAAYSTPTVTQSTNFPVGSLALFSNAMIADTSTATWQSMSVTMTLPAGTTHVLVVLDAGENNWNDTNTTEFSGHFADAARFTYTPTPGTLVIAAGTLLFAARRRR